MARKLALGLRWYHWALVGVWGLSSWLANVTGATVIDVTSLIGSLITATLIVFVLTKAVRVLGSLDHDDQPDN